MKLLIIGGTIFLGRHLVETARAAGHEITLFNRGRSNPALLPDLERIRGDRTGDLSCLGGRRWDAVIDTCGYLPRIVRASASALADAVDRYVYISSLSALAEPSSPGLAEDAPTESLEDPKTENVTGSTYGGLKALCEGVVEAELAARALNIRPGLIVGPHDPSDRFTYWVTRIARGGDVLAPGKPADPVQLIDARDLARFILLGIERALSGIYHATGPTPPTSMGVLFDTCRDTFGSDASFVWAKDEFLLENQVTPYTEMPLWVAGSPGFNAVSIDKAVAAGLRTRDLSETVEATADWRKGDPGPMRAGLSPEREAELMRLWRARG
ncbi:MAG: epimerase [Gemmatimonadetes bacterium]|nr:epimerase [Gemmatimonadota bacterium]